MAESYDETRCVDPACLSASLDYLAETFSPEQFSELLEPGIGTGRIAVPLAELGYKVCGIDVSADMLAVLQNRLKQMDANLPVTFQQGDVLSLPFPSGHFDIAVAVHLFYFIRDWRRAVDELLRVVHQGGPVVLMHTGMGREVPFVNDLYKKHCSQQGCSIKSVGVSSTREVIGYVTELGCSIETVADRWEWTSRIRIDEAIAYLRGRAYSFTTVAPDDIHNRAIERLEADAIETHGSLECEIEVPNQVKFVTVRKPGL